MKKIVSKSLCNTSRRGGGFATSAVQQKLPNYLSPVNGMHSPHAPINISKALKSLRRSSNILEDISNTKKKENVKLLGNRKSSVLSGHSDCRYSSRGSRKGMRKKKSIIDEDQTRDVYFSKKRKFTKGTSISKKKIGGLMSKIGEIQQRIEKGKKGYMGVKAL